MQTTNTSSNLNRLGAQSYSFREFDLDGAIQCLQALNLTEMEFCGVHFPSDPAAAVLPDVRAKLQAAGIIVPVFGVEHFNNDLESNRKRFEFARAMGVGIFSAYPEPEAFEGLDALVEEFQVKIAIHNHGPESIYNTVAQSLGALQGRHPFIGACVDTGHVLRAGEAPHEVIAQLGNRVHSVHLKDWIVGGDEQIIGEGDMDLLKTAQALKDIGFNGPIMLEYELSPAGPVDDMKKSIVNWRNAVAQVS